MADRITIEAGADAYLMKHIRKQMPASGKLILVEAVIAGRNESHFSKFLDLEMRVAPTPGMSCVLEASPK